MCDDVRLQDERGYEPIARFAETETLRATDKWTDRAGAMKQRVAESKREVGARGETSGSREPRRSLSDRIGYLVPVEALAYCRF